ncbi:MAG: di-heme oxidoredictase family protein [Pseudomonadota bacterium]
MRFVLPLLTCLTLVVPAFSGALELQSPSSPLDDPRRPGGDYLTHDPAWTGPAGLLYAIPPTNALGQAWNTSGAALLRANWLANPTPGKALAGPDYDAPTCGRCHLELEPTAAARTSEPAVVLRPALMADRLRYGPQLNTLNSNGDRPEAVASVHWETHWFTFEDGTRRALRRPQVTVVTVDGRELPATRRMAPLLFGWGLLEQLPPQTLAHFHDPDDRNGDGISGQRTGSETEPGIFGWKGAHSTLRGQVAAALAHDMGVTSAAVCPGTGCTPELASEDLDRMVAWLASVGVPARRPGASQRGADLFGQTGCGGCHISALRTAPGSDSRLAEQTVWAYTDLALHDMGEGLADPGDAPDRREWRTAPLWSVGLAEQLLPQRGFLHDGRARDLEEAILWHGGEALAARDRFAALSARERAELLAYLRSL